MIDDKVAEAKAGAQAASPISTDVELEPLAVDEVMRAPRTKLRMAAILIALYVCIVPKLGKRH